MHDFMLRCSLLFAYCIVYFTHQNRAWPILALWHSSWEPLFSSTLWWAPTLCLCRLLLFTFTAQWPWLCWSAAFVMYFRKGRSSLCSGSLVQSIMKRGLCLAPCQTWLTAQIWTRNGESLLVYACMHESMWFRGSDLRLCCRKDKWLLVDYKWIHLQNVP